MSVSILLPDQLAKQPTTWWLTPASSQARKSKVTRIPKAIYAPQRERPLCELVVWSATSLHVAFNQIVHMEFKSNCILCCLFFKQYLEKKRRNGDNVERCRKKECIGIVVAQIHKKHCGIGLTFLQSQLRPCFSAVKAPLLNMPYFLLLFFSGIMFFIVDFLVLCFVFMMKTVFITQGCFSYDWSVIAQIQGLFCFSYSPVSK